MVEFIRYGREKRLHQRLIKRTQLKLHSPQISPSFSSLPVSLITVSISFSSSVANHGSLLGTGKNRCRCCCCLAFVLSTFLTLQGQVLGAHCFFVFFSPLTRSHNWSIMALHLLPCAGPLQVRKVRMCATEFPRVQK